MDYLRSFLGLSSSSSSQPSESQRAMSQSDSKQNPDRLPTLFSFHGGGPSFFMPTIKGDRWENISKDSPFANFLRSFTKEQLKGQKPKAILVVSGHWDSYEIEVNACDRHSLYYDYYGFPDFTYNLDYPAVGNPKLAERVAELVKAHTEFPVSLNKERGLDHGVFVPLMLMFPEADVPIIQVSLHRSFNYADHIKLGEALAPLRDEGVLIYGSGALTHGFRAAKSDVAPFVDWCKDTLTNPELSVEERNKRLGDIAQAAPGYRAAHPTPDHLIPLHAAVGAANSKPGTIMFDGWSGAFSLFAIRFD